MSRVVEHLSAGGAIARRLPGFETRPQQLELARAVERTIAEGGHLLAEAGTGVGKSFAYLLPAVLHASETRGQGPVVVSTRTIALQEQLEHKDVPFLKSVLPVEWSTVTAVGRSHYLCLRRMHMAELERAHVLPGFAQQAELQRIHDWSMTTGSGLRMDLPEPVSDEVWDEVRAEHGNCLGRACKFYEPCGWQRGRRRMENASLLIVNHALYMADVALRMAGAAYLPAHRIVIFDEAHHLERVATESLGLRLTRGSMHWHLKRLRPRGAATSLLDRLGLSIAIELVERLRVAVDSLFADLETRLARASDSALALRDEPIEESVREPLMELEAELLRHAAGLDELDLKTELAARAKGLAGLRMVVTHLCHAEGMTPKQVRWLEQDKRGPRLCSAPLDVSEALATHVFDAAHTTVLTSATLAAGKDDEHFAWLSRQLGIEGARTLRLGSPFDFARQAQLVLEESLPDPSAEPSRFAAESKERIVARVLENGGHALVLCTSWSFVRDVAAALAQPLAARGLRLLVQGQARLAQLLSDKQHDPSSVLVGTDSLWEGIDLPGDALTLVIIARFPFAQPGHPLVEARLAAIAARGGNPFLEHSLPEAIVKFRQGFGRLIRSGSDHGKVVVLDPRARTKPYGRLFLEALPEGLC